MNARRNLRLGQSLGRATVLAALVLVVVSPLASAEITLFSRISSAGALAFVSDGQGGSNDDRPPPKEQTDFLPANLSNSASITDFGVTATADTTSISSINLDTSADTLAVTGEGTGDCTNTVDGQAGGSGQASATIIALSFTLSEVSYTYNLAGHLSGKTLTDFLQAQLTGPNGTIFSVTAGQGSVEDVDLNQSGTLPPGSYTFQVALFAQSFAGTPGDADANFDFNIQPVGAPTPTPSPGIQWNNPAGGDFHTATNWDPQTVPGSSDTAVFGLQVPYSVDVGTATTNRLEIRNGDLTFTDGFDYSVNDITFAPSGIVLDNAKLTLGVGALEGAHMLIGESAASQVDLLEGAIINLTGSLQVGGPGEGILNSTDGGIVLSGEGRIATGVGGGTATFSGFPSGWSSGNLSVGFSGNGTLAIESGAGVTSDGGFVGFEAGSSGAVTIVGDPLGSDPQSNWTCANLTIANNGGGAVAADSQGELIVTSQLTVGQASIGFLNILGGAQGSAHDITAGAGQGSSGLMTVSGKSSAGPSFLSAEQNIILGLEGDGTLKIEEDGVVTCFDAALGVLAGSIGSANLGVDGAAGDPARWVVNGNMTIGGLAPGSIALHNSASVSVGNTLSILANGSIGGNGTYSALTVVNEGNNGPGNSVGMLTIESDYEQTTTGKLTIEAEGLGEGEFDVLHVTGNAILGGTLEMLFPGSYLPQAGDSFTFLEVDGTISGDFDEVIFPQLLPGFQFDTIQIPGGFVLSAINDAVLAPTFLLNISTRIQVGLDENVLIGGFILTGTEPKQVLIRAVGPSLESVGVAGALADPTLELHDSTGAIVGTNDNWRTTQIGGFITDDQFLAIHATGIPPIDNAESAIIATLDPGAYTAIVRGVSGAPGVGLVEAYNLD